MPGKTKAAEARKTTTTAKKVPAKTRKTMAAKGRKKSEENDFAIDFCGVKLTALRRDFIVNYVTPGQPCFHNALQAALKAGYKEGVAKARIYDILRDPDIQKIIKKNESMAHRALHESAMRALELKQRRAFFDPLDYFQEKEITITGKDGGEYTKSVMALKPLEEMTVEQRMCIDGVDVKGPAAVPVYLMANRERELNDIIKIDNELSKAIADTGEEETREIIMERITIRETRRAKRPADLEYEIVENPDLTITEEEDD
ncbi:MAG: terminase small subunit [Treponema sp.]|jgi:phage terminase small subunit|nr:terminase small subunit [Treponema sp.]